MSKIVVFLRLWTVYFYFQGNESIYPEIPLNFFFILCLNKMKKEFCTWLYHIPKIYAKLHIFNEAMANLHN